MDDWAGEERTPRLLKGDRDYMTIGQVMTSPFMIGQLILNIVASYCGVFFCFWLIFIVFGPDEYGCYSSQVLSPVLISPFATPVLALAWAPVGMIDAIEKGWFGFVHDSELEGGIFRFLPCLQPQVGFFRHCLLGLELAAFAIPIMMLIVIFGIASDQTDELSDGLDCVLTDWEQVISCVTYIAILPIFVIPIGLLGFAKESNMERVYRVLSDKSFIQKGIYSPIC